MPFPSSLVPPFQSESKCKTILMKMTFICMKMKLHMCRTHFHMKGLALRLVLKQRHKRTQKWPIRREKQTASGLGLNNSTTLIGVRAPLDFGGRGGGGCPHCPKNNYTMPESMCGRNALKSQEKQKRSQFVRPRNVLSFQNYS